MRRGSLFFVGCWTVLGSCSVAQDAVWTKHIIHEGAQTMTAVAGDFTGDGLPDVIADSANKTRLFVAPDWQEVILDDHPDVQSYIHSESFDVDGDGDLDYIGARYNPGLIVWLEQPRLGASERWLGRLIDDSIHGIHGLIQGDVDGDGKTDLLATSAQPKPPYPESLAWFRVPAEPREAERWKPRIFADRDAPGLTHYLGVGDVDHQRSEASCQVRQQTNRDHLVLGVNAEVGEHLAAATACGGRGGLPATTCCGGRFPATGGRRCFATTAIGRRGRISSIVIPTRRYDERECGEHDEPCEFASHLRPPPPDNISLCFSLPLGGPPPPGGVPQETLSVGEGPALPVVPDLDPDAIQPEGFDDQEHDDKEAEQHDVELKDAQPRPGRPGRNDAEVVG